MAGHVAGAILFLIIILAVFVPRGQIWAAIRENGKIAILSFFGLCLLWWWAFGRDADDQQDAFERRRRQREDDNA